MISRAMIEEAYDRLSLEYRNLWSMEQTEALAEEFTDQTNDQDFREALRRHRHDRTEGSRGTPVGQYPPTSANIEAQLVALNVERMRAAQEKRQREVKAESNQTYKAAILGQGVSRDERTKAHGEKIREQVRLAAQVRGHLEVKLGLDYRLQGDMKLLMKTLGAVDLANQTLEEIEEVAREVADSLGMELGGRAVPV